jgi:hypothetical protein
VIYGFGLTQTDKEQLQPAMVPTAAVAAATAAAVPASVAAAQRAQRRVANSTDSAGGCCSTTLTAPSSRQGGDLRQRTRNRWWCSGAPSGGGVSGGATVPSMSGVYQGYFKVKRGKGGKEPTWYAKASCPLPEKSALRTEACLYVTMAVTVAITRVGRL